MSTRVAAATGSSPPHRPANSFEALPGIGWRMPRIGRRWLWLWRIVYRGLAAFRHLRIQRWVTRRKAEVVAAVHGGLLSAEDACDRYALTKEEFAGWERLYQRHGVKGLRTTRLQNYR